MDRTRRLLVAREDQLADRGKLPRQLAESGVSAWFHFGVDASRRLTAERGALRDLERISVRRGFHAATERLRRPYLAWIAELGASNDCEEWWTSELAAKNPYYFVFTWICLAAAVAELLRDSEEPLLAVCPTREMSEELAELARAAGWQPTVLWGARQRNARRAVRTLARRAVEGSAGWAPTGRGVPPFVLRRLNASPEYRRRVLARLAPRPRQLPGGKDVILLVSWADERCLSPEGAIRDPFLGPLPEMLADSGYRLVRLAQVLPGAAFERIARGFLEIDGNTIFPEAWISPEERRECARRARRFAPRIPDGARLEEVRVDRIAAEKTRATLGAHAASLTFLPLLANLSRAGLRPGAVIHPFEGHSWEGGLRIAARAHLPTARVIGSDLGHFSRWMLSLFAAPAEMERHPFPDRVVTNGRALRDLLLDEGWRPDRVEVGAGVRHGYLHDAVVRSRHRPGARKPYRVLVAGSIDVAESAELLDVSMRAVAGREGWELWVKSHPGVPRTTLERFAPELGRSGNVRIVERPVSEILGEVDVLAYANTVTCYEAIAHGVLPVFVRPEAGLALDKLEPFPELGLRIDGADEMREEIERALAWSEEAYADWRRRAAAAIEIALGPPRGDLVARYLGT